MDELYSILNSQAVLNGVSVAIIQYLFLNHRKNIDNLINQFSNLDFIDDNYHEQGLKAQWEEILANCKSHTYAVDPSKSIKLFFYNIAFISFLYILIPVKGHIPRIVDLEFIITTVLPAFTFVNLLLNLTILEQMHRKENECRSKLDNVKNEHNIATKVLRK